jgi:hypothetical protein
MHKIIGLAVLLCAAVAVAANTQVSPSSFVKANSFYGRSDGLYQDTTAKGLVAVTNGTVSQPIGPAIYEDFTKYGAGKGLACLIASSGAACGGATTTVPVRCVAGDGFSFIREALVTEDICAVTTAVGLDISGDQTNNDGSEVNTGMLGASGRPFVIGDDPAFYFCATIKITDVSGSDLLVAGFRRAEAFTATFDNYNDLAGIGSVSGDIYLKTILNNAATTSTDTTDNWADAATKKLCTYVSNAGVVTYTIDGVAPTTTAAFTFDDGDPVIPFVHLLHDADLAETTAITKWEVGYTQ